MVHYSRPELVGDQHSLFSVGIEVGEYHDSFAKLTKVEDSLRNTDQRLFTHSLLINSLVSGEGISTQDFKPFQNYFWIPASRRGI